MRQAVGGMKEQGKSIGFVVQSNEGNIDMSCKSDHRLSSYTAVPMTNRQHIKTIL